MIALIEAIKIDFILFICYVFIKSELLFAYENIYKTKNKY
jgi:hypothetical protein